MNIVFLIGNGFDLACGLDTGYASFLEWYCSQASSDDIIAAFKMRIKEDREDERGACSDKWSDCELAKGEDTSSYDDGDSFLHCWGDFFVQLLAYLKTQEARFSDDGVPDYAEVVKRSIIAFHETLEVKDCEIVVEHPYYYGEQDIKIDFISFNYTNVLDRVLDFLGDSILKSWTYHGSRTAKVGKIVHPHGDMLHGSYVFGVNDSKQVSNQTLLDNEDVAIDVIKHNSNSVCKTHQESEAKQMIRNSDIIYIFGMSLGDSDRQWWEEIGAWLARSPRHILIIQQNKAVSSQMPIWQQYREEQKVKDWFLSKTGLDNDAIADVSSQVIVSFKPEIFQFESLWGKFISRC